MEPCSIIEKIPDLVETQFKDDVSSLKVTKNNVNYAFSLGKGKLIRARSFPLQQQEEIDLTISAVLKPIKLVYRPV